MKKLIIILLTAFCSATVYAQHNHGAEETPGAEKVNADHSLYHLNAEWTDHRGDTFTLNKFKGAPVIVVMFYGNCTEVCPILIRDTWRLYSEVDEALRPAVHILAVTFDTENDTPQILKEYAEYEQLDIEGWHFVTSKDSNIRSLAMMLGVQYSRKSDGHYSHSNLVSVLDEEGKIADRVEGLNQPMDEAAEVIKSILKKNIQ